MNVAMASQPLSIVLCVGQSLLHKLWSKMLPMAEAAASLVPNGGSVKITASEPHEKAVNGLRKQQTCRPANPTSELCTNHTEISHVWNAAIIDVIHNHAFSALTLKCQ